MKAKTIGLALSLGAGALLSGCSSVPNYDVEIYPSSRLVQQYGYMPSLEVDVAGVNENESARIKSANVDQYFEPGNALRRSLAPTTLRFSQDDVRFKTLDDDDAIWEAWADRGAVNLAILVNLPEAAGDPVTDARKILVPIVKDGWFSRNSGRLRFEIIPGGLIQIKAAPESDATPVKSPEPVPAAVILEEPRQEEKNQGADHAL